MEAVIKSKHFLTEGGCNACGLVNCSTYTLYLPTSHGLMVSEMDVENLVATIALAHQWQQSYEAVGIGEDTPVFVKDGNRIVVEELGKFISYQRDGQKILAENQLCDETELFAKVNEILTQLFAIEAIDFTVEEE